MSIFDFDVVTGPSLQKRGETPDPTAPAAPQPERKAVENAPPSVRVPEQSG